jgi:hypothetical protein
MHCRHHLLAGLLLALCVASCSEEDRVYTVHCPPTNGAFSVDFESTDTESQGVGELNSKPLSIGSILRVTPGPSPTETGTAHEVYRLRTANLDLLPPRVVDSGRLVANLRIEVDADVKQAAARLGIDLEQLITSGTRLYIFRGTLKSVRDVAALTNADPAAVDLIRANSKEMRFLVISAAIYGFSTHLFTNVEPLKYVSGNAVKLGDFYLHGNVVCPAVHSPFFASSRRSRRANPIIVFYTPVTYDESTANIVVDARRIDLNNFALDSDR